MVHFPAVVHHGRNTRNSTLSSNPFERTDQKSRPHRRRKKGKKNLAWSKFVCRIRSCCFSQGTKSRMRNIFFFTYELPCQDWFTIYSLAFLIRCDGWEHGPNFLLERSLAKAGMAQNGSSRKGLRHVALLSLISFLVKVLNKPSTTPIATTRRS